MKKICAVLLATVMILLLAACGKDNNSPQPDTNSNAEFTGKAIVVYYSGPGNTKRVAEYVADELKADTFEH